MATDDANTQGGFEVAEPVLNSPYEKPALHWRLEDGQAPEKRSDRREAGYYYRDPKVGREDAGGDEGHVRVSPRARVPFMKSTPVTARLPGS